MAPVNDVDWSPIPQPPPPETHPSRGLCVILGLGMLVLFLAGVGACFLLHSAP